MEIRWKRSLKWWICENILKAGGGIDRDSGKYLINRRWRERGERKKLRERERERHRERKRERGDRDRERERKIF